MILRCIAVYLLSFWASSSVLAEGPVWKNGALYFEGARINTSILPSDLKFGVEGGAIFSVQSSPNGAAKLLKIIPPKGEIEIWLLRTVFAEKPAVQLAVLLADFNVDWATNQYVVATRHHMGASESYIYQLNAHFGVQRHTENLSQLLAFDPATGLIVQMATASGKDRLIVQPAFGGTGQEIAVETDYKFLADALFSVKNVRIEACVLQYDVKQANQMVPQRALIASDLCPGSP